MISGSFKTPIEIQAMEPTWIPSTFTLDNYRDMNRTVPILKFFKNSLIISLGTMIVTVVIGTLAAYSISRFRFRGRNAYQLSLFSTQMLPGILFLIPYFVMFTWIKNTLGIPMTNTYHGMIFTYTSFSLPFSIIMLRNYLDSVPREIDEQAMIDGCSRVKALFKVILPLAKPGIAAVGIYSFIMAWNEILFAMVLTRTETRTISIGLLQYITSNQAHWGQMMAACIMTTIPVIVLFTLMQKHIVQGLVSGATKG
ncbi:binding-protein-dependent transport systems inner membrane component [Halothermothrix orenii H 168]|uniref:Binding-protein-dependent transport systems inner membrane component n=2 Tax=Halothermothrix orenii TaxID=31909 RepID=B8CZK6_HALOH|nr:binding-protein-dependent transport systems inner membrane component [Halothermothrix orenii H 168]